MVPTPTTITEGEAGIICPIFGKHRAIRPAAPAKMGPMAPGALFLVMLVAAAPAPAVHRAAFRDRAAMVLIDAGNGCWAAFNPRTAGIDLAWRGDVDWRGKVHDFSQETSRPRGETLLDRTRPIAALADTTLAPGTNVILFTGAGTPGPRWHSLLVAFEERSRQPVSVRVSEADGSERVRFESATHVSSDAEWQWNFKAVGGPTLPFAIEWRNEGTAPKPLRALRLEGEQVAWTDRDGNPLAVAWRGYEPLPDAVLLHFDLAGADGRRTPVVQRIAAAGRGLRVETRGLPAEAGWTSNLAADPRLVEIGVAR